MNTEDPTILTSMYKVVNPDHTNKKIDLEKLEKQFTGKIAIEEPNESVDPTQAFKDVMNNFLKGVKNSEPAVIPQSFTLPKHNDIEEDDDSEETELDNITNEKIASDQVRYVMSRINDSEEEEHHISFETEKEEEEKLNLLESIDFLKSQLEAEGVEMGHIKKVDKDTDIADIRNVQQILQRKNTRRTYCSMAEDAILMLVYGVEYLCDGKKKWGPYTPDLTGWHNTVKPKLRAMRYETSTIVSEIMNEYNIGPFWRMVIELIPSAILHSHMRTKRKEAGRYNLEEMAEAYNKIEDFNKKKT